eukprot:CAMPEP_0185490852 /NCGR_PEP_ID=MMETSP1366-20130426/14257_1 /TAXON_ID=38817 /ORGANISM="Gephyrocapsa oceanica, Strain RCC1303" /LENGTH=108 /DNA_ID=CAMNT_0028099565 /DNA_START=75 /DNA_END=398 /DNA_ORIENTATION=+
MPVTGLSPPPRVKRLGCERVKFAVVPSPSLPPVRARALARGRVLVVLVVLSVGLLRLARRRLRLQRLAAFLDQPARLLTRGEPSGGGELLVVEPATRRTRRSGEVRAR